MKKITNKLVGGALLFGLSMSLTSCEGALDDILGEWSRPVQIKECPISFSISSKLWGTKDSKFTIDVSKKGEVTVTFSSSDPSVATVDPNTGEVTPVGVGVVDIIAKIVVDNEGEYESTTAKYTLTIEQGYSYQKWNEETGSYEQIIIHEMHELGELKASYFSGSELPGGTYIVNEDITLPVSTIRQSGDVDLILCDGKTLTINEAFFGNNGSGPYKLNVYGQSENSGKLIVKSGMGGFQPLNVYGGIIEVGEPGDTRDYRFADLFGMNIYGGKVTVFNHKDGIINSVRIKDGYKLAIYGGEMTVDTQHTGGTSSNCTGISGDVEINDGKLTVTSVKSSSTNANAINGNLTVNGGTVSLYGGPNAEQDKAVKGTITAGAGVTLEESDDATSWTTISSTSSAKKYIRTKQ